MMPTIQERLDANKPFIYKEKVQGKEFFVSSCGSYNTISLIESFCYERQLREDWWLVKPGDIVIDVGAGYGSYVCCSIALGAALVIAYEPAKAEFFDLSTQLLANGWLDKCIPLNVLAGLEITYREDYYPHSHSFRPMGKPEARMVIPIDIVAERFVLQKIDWLKIDVEGDELNVLRGAANSLMRFSPQVMIEIHEEFIPGIGKEVECLMESYGYIESKRYQGESGSNELWVLWSKKNGE